MAWDAMRFAGHTQGVLLRSTDARSLRIHLHECAPVSRSDNNSPLHALALDVATHSAPRYVGEAVRA